MDFLQLIYSFVMHCSTWVNNDPRAFLDNYFVTEEAFTSLFLIAAGVAVVGAAIFYGWIGMTVNRLSNMLVWVVFLIVTGLLSLLITQSSVIGFKDSQTGIYKSIVDRTTILAHGTSPNDQTARTAIFNDSDSMKNRLSGGCDVTWTLLILNAIYSMLIFLLLSILTKRFTNYAIAIPF